MIRSTLLMAGTAAVLASSVAATGKDWAAFPGWSLSGPVVRKLPFLLQLLPLPLMHQILQLSVDPNNSLSPTACAAGCASMKNVCLYNLSSVHEQLHNIKPFHSLLLAVRWHHLGRWDMCLHGKTGTIARQAAFVLTPSFFLKANRRRFLR